MIAIRCSSLPADRRNRSKLYRKCTMFVRAMPVWRKTSPDSIKSIKPSKIRLTMYLSNLAASSFNRVVCRTSSASYASIQTSTWLDWTLNSVPISSRKLKRSNHSNASQSSSKSKVSQRLKTFTSLSASVSRQRSSMMTAWSPARRRLWGYTNHCKFRRVRALHPTRTCSSCSGKSSWRTKRSEMEAFLAMTRWWQAETLERLTGTPKTWSIAPSSKSAQTRKRSRREPTCSTSISSGLSSRDSLHCRSSAWCYWERMSITRLEKYCSIRSEITSDKKHTLPTRSSKVLIDHLKK